MTIAATGLVVLRVRQTDRVTKLVNCNTLEIYRARDSVSLCIVDRESKTVADFGVELNVVVQNRSGFVETCRKLMITISVSITNDSNCRRNIRVAVAVDVESIGEI